MLGADSVARLTVGNEAKAHELNDILLRESDVVSFHSYRNPAASRVFIKEQAVHKRPLICTEWMCCTHNNTIRNCLGIYKETGVGCMMWGLVNGRRGRCRASTRPCRRRGRVCGRTADTSGFYRSPYDAGELELLKKATKGIGW